MQKQIKDNRGDENRNQLIKKMTEICEENFDVWIIVWFNLNQEQTQAISGWLVAFKMANYQQEIQRGPKEGVVLFVFFGRFFL